MASDVNIAHASRAGWFLLCFALVALAAALNPSSGWSAPSPPSTLESVPSYSTGFTTCINCIADAAADVPPFPSVIINDADTATTSLDALQVRWSLGFIRPPFMPFTSLYLRYKPPAIYLFWVRYEEESENVALPHSSGREPTVDWLRMLARCAQVLTHDWGMVKSMLNRLKESVGFGVGCGWLDAFCSTTFRQAPHFRRSFIEMYATIDSLSLGCPPLTSLWAKLDCSFFGYEEAKHSPGMLGPCLTDADASLNIGFVGFAGLCWMPLMLEYVVLGFGILALGFVFRVASGRSSRIMDVVRSVTKTPAVSILVFSCPWV